MKNIKVYLADDHNIFRQGLAELLLKKGNIQIVGEAENGRAAIAGIDKTKPDIVFLDISMPELNGIDAAGLILKQYPNIKIIILSMFDKSKYICSALRSGISGYLLKDTNVDELFEAIDTVMNNQVFLSNKINQKVIHDFVDITKVKDYSSPIDSLSAREREVFQLMAEGHPGKVIADKLNISYKTVEHHRYKVFSKLACINIAELVKLAIKEGVVTA